MFCLCDYDFPQIIKYGVVGQVMRSNQNKWIKRRRQIPASNDSIKLWGHAHHLQRIIILWRKALRVLAGVGIALGAL